MSNADLSKRSMLTNTLLVGGGVLGLASVASATTTTGMAIKLVDTFVELNSISADIGDIAHLKCYSRDMNGVLSGVGGGEFIAKSGSSSNDLGTTINCKVGGTAAYWVRIDFDCGQPLRPEWWGADPRNQVDSWSAFNMCFAKAKGKIVELSGIYKLLNPLVIDYADTGGLTIRGKGASLLEPGAIGYNKCALNFDNIAIGQKALTLKGIRGLVLEDFLVSHKTSGVGGGVAIWLTQLDDFRVTHVNVESQTGNLGGGFQFGATNGVDCVFMGVVKNCKVYTQGGASFAVQPTCTSITFESCYQIGGYYYFQSAVYCNLIGCASEVAPLFGYILYGCTNITFVGCAGEANARGVFYLQTGCSNINIISPFGAGNNTSNLAVNGDLICLDGSAGANSNIYIVSPTSLASGSNTVANIGSIGPNGYTEVNNIYSPNLPKGISGPASFKQNYLATTGDLEVMDFVPTITGWTNNGNPIITAKFVRKGKLVNFSIKVAPAINISSTRLSSRISLPFTNLVIESVAAVVDGNAASYGNAIIGVNGVIWLPSFGPLTVPVTITGSFLTT